jgi:hypothetical protein
MSTLKKLSTENIKFLISACQKLIDWYKEGKLINFKYPFFIGEKGNCPICPIIRYIEKNRKSTTKIVTPCSPCPWVYFTGHDCHEGALKCPNNYDEYDINQLRNKRPFYWKEKRLAELPIWIKELKKILKSKEKYA